MEKIITTVSIKSVAILANDTVRRANVIAHRTGDEVMGIVKAQMIDLLKEKLHNGVAHFFFLKKDGTLREAWGTTCANLMKANINGRGYSRDSVNTVAYWDIEAGGFRSLRFENLVKVL